MNLFNQLLVQNKRRKMLILTVLLFLLGFVNKSGSINLTYILKKEQNRLQPNCIAEENIINSAIGWIYPIPDNKENLPNITTKFIPTITNNFNCKFSKHAKCNKIWSLKNWEIDENSSRTFDFIADGRWDDFSIIFTSNNTKEFEERIEIPNIFRSGFSVRASDSVELFICEGWNPYNYPCYHLNMSSREIFLRKYLSVPKIISNENVLDSYKVNTDIIKAYSNILSHDEWRSFVLSLTDMGMFELIDVNLNRTVIQFQDKEALKPLYILMRSAEPSLWKIHHNEYIYTVSAQISRLGPTLILPSKDLCVSLYASTCLNCAMTFFLMKNNERKILKEVQGAKQFEWRAVRLKDENVLSDKVNIFVETKFINSSSGQENGFWAVDDIRICHESEIKVSFLKLEDDIKSEDDVDSISCQVVEHPKWRPKKLVYSEIKDIPVIESSSNSTSITLTWTDEDINKFNYFITYKANDICTSEPHNMRRIKSNDFLMTKHNEITINNLIPYTLYNITFSTIFHENGKEMFENTLESDLPTPEELPNKVQIQVTDTTAYVSWDKVDCTSLYGHLIYSMKLTNIISNTTKTLKEQTDNVAEIQELKPFTMYSLNILTSRDIKNFENDTKTIGLVVNFTTKPGVAPAIRHLELYSIDQNSVSFRYILPENPKGIPVYIQIARCNTLLFKKCKVSMSVIKPCKLWPKKYCVEVNNLIPYQTHTFKLSIKNDYTNSFGDEVQIDGYTMEQVPGTPTNITYRIVDCEESLDYCHLNISWLHPYNQNGTITSFNIILNSTNGNEAERIQEVLKIDNKTYSPQYNYQVKYIPYSTHYELYVQAANTQYKSNFANTHVKTADVGDHIDQSPKLLEKSDSTLIFKLPHVDRRLKSYKLTTIVQDYDKDKSVGEDIENNKAIAGHLCHNFGNTWISHDVIEVTNNNSRNLTIGSGENSNKYLKPSTQYCVTFIVRNYYKNSEHDVVYYEKFETLNGTIVAETEANKSGQYGHLYVLLLLLLLVPVGFVIYRYIMKRKPKSNPEQSGENVYESLPFEECDNCVHNETYDHLLHK